MSDGPYEVCELGPGIGNAPTWMIRHTGRGITLGGVGANFYRTWVFPLYTPSGYTVLDAFPFDHPFHNGLFVAQHPVRQGERTGNFWAVPPRRRYDDPIFTAVGRADTAAPQIAVRPCGATITLQSIWRDEHEQPLLNEVRTCTFRLFDDATACDVHSLKTAAYGPLAFPQTKYGTIGARVEPRLVPAMGGAVLTDPAGGYIVFERSGVGPRYGLCLVSHSLSGAAWIVRDYGLVVHNPAPHADILLPPGESWSVNLRAVAYEGTFDPRRLDAWRDAQI